MMEHSAERPQAKKSGPETEEMTSVILECCGIQCWTYDPVTDAGASGLHAMAELGVLQTWENFPQSLIDRGLICGESAQEWLRLHQRVRQGEAHVSGEVEVMDQGIPIWKRIQYYTHFGEDGSPASATGIAENTSAYRRLTENYAQAAKQCGMSIWMFDFARKIIYDMNSSMHVKSFEGVRIVRDVPEVFARADSPLYPGDRAAYLAMFDRLLAGAHTVKSEGRWWSEERGAWLWYESAYTAVLDENGAPVRAIGTAVDISERVRLEERYREEIKWRKVHNQDVLGSFKLNLTQNTCEEGQSDSPMILSFQGDGTADDFFLREYAAHKDATDLEEYKRTFNRASLLRAYQEGKTSVAQETYMKFDEDKTRWIKVELDMLQNPKNGDIEGYIYATDIDQAKTAQALVDSVVNLDYDFLALLEIATDTYTIFSKTAGKTPLPAFHTSNYAQEIVQYNEAYLVEEDIVQNAHDMSYENLVEQLEKQDVYTIYCGVKEFDGSISRKKLQFSYLDKPRKKIILARTDITEIYRQEQQKNQALKDALLAAQQANTAKSEFLSRMSHEIRTPMNTIIGMSALAADCVDDPKQVSSYLAKVGLSARFLLSLINDILDMSRIESGKVLMRSEKIPFEEFIGGINSICYAQAKERGVEYEAILTSATEETYLGDAMKLQQVMINIISNAIKFTPSGGRVQMMIHQERLSPTQAQLSFTVNDTGVGISEDFLPQLFEPFEQAHTGPTTPYGGTGLGLAICKNLVDLMGGRIRVNSIVGVGSEFVVEVKLGICPQRQGADPGAMLHLERLKALIVDDDIIICRHTQQVLEDMRLHAEYVVSGEQAVALVTEKLRKQEIYDIVLLDWKMPHMDGIETARALRKIVGPEVTIIIMTAYDWVGIEAEAKQAGVNLLITKPLFKATLASAFEQLSHGKVGETRSLSPAEFDFTGKRVLLVEDHQLNIEVAKKLLTAKHLEVEVAENGLQAIETFAQRPDGYYDAILMDIRMPVMDGLTATCSIRQMRKADAKKIPIIAMTANAFDEDIERTKQAGMNAHLAKPIEPLQLYQTMQRFLWQGGATI